MTISVVVPCFNEEESIPLFYREMERVRMKMGEKFEYIFINDGSSDGTLSVLRKLHVTDSNVHYLSFSRNFGKEAALYAGLERASGEFVTVMDVDLQDPPELLIEMKQKLEEQPDLDCVGTRRVTRDGEPPIRSFFARMFYKLINHISQVEMVDGARDFRLMRRPMVLQDLKIDDQKEEVIVLRHVILSHHGLLEYGSPVRPKIMEAEIIHMIDNLDAEMMMMTTALGLIGPGEMTNKIFAMENRSFYKPNLD